MAIHAPLNEDNREIRLVRFLRRLAVEDDDPPDLIELELTTVSLDDVVSYAALSYVWGDPADTVEVEIDGHPFAVTRNLHDGLEQLKRNGVGFWLWIDAICIQQSDLEEKSQQINAMGDIFSGAELVYMWLGPGTQETDLVMDLISRLGPRLHPPTQEDNEESQEMSDYDAAVADLVKELGENKEDLASGIEGTLLRSYWSRIWIIQEVVLAKQALVVIGSSTAPVEDFYVTFVAIRRERFIPEGILLTFYILKCLDARWAHHEGDSSVRLVDMLWEPKAAPYRPHYAASDPRDLVFGLLGVLSEEEKQGICVDYTQSFVDVFAQATRTMIGSERPGCGHFDIDYVIPRDPDGMLPTWVPDWEEIGRYGARPYPIGINEAFHATRERPRPTRELKDNKLEESRILLRWGCLVDEITEVMETPEWPAVDLYIPSAIANPEHYFRSIIRFAGLGPDAGSGEDYIWRTLLRGGDMHAFAHSWRCRERCATTEAVQALWRRIMRVEAIDTANLTAEQERFILSNRWTFHEFEGRKLGSDMPFGNEAMEIMARQWRESIGTRNRNRTLFKTAKGMFGLGHDGIEVGDVVTLIWGAGSPIILRRRDEGGYFFRGDAYVDGIMDGEFLDTDPKEEEFAIH